MIYKKLNDTELTGRPSVLCIMPRDFEKMSYIMGFSIPILEFLGKDNDLLIITGKEGGSDCLFKYGPTWGIAVSQINKLKEKKFKRAEEMENNSEYNTEILVDELRKSFPEGTFKNVRKVLVFDPIDFILPQTSYIGKKEHVDMCERKNEFHDSVSPDKEELKLIKKINQKVCSKYDYKTNVLAFGSHYKNITYNIIKMAFKEADNFEMAYAFINDPAFYTPIFEFEKIPFTAYYFADDNRGTRKFKKFPLGELQHIVWDGRAKAKNLLDFGDGPITKFRSVFFAGTIFQEKGGRVDLWNRYLRDLRCAGAGIYVPLRANGILYSKTVNGRYMNKIDEDFADLKEEITSHPNYEGHLTPDEYEDTVKTFQYGLILRCISHCDSLNFRPVLYARLRILPLLDPGYDPDYLQIPKDIQDKIRVKDSDDIAEKVKYFDKNTKEREDLLNRLEEIFQVKTFSQTWNKILKDYF